MMISIHKICLLIFTIMYSVTSSSQSNRIIDSLEKRLLNLKEDTSKVNILNELSSQYRNVNVQTSIQYAKDALSLSKNINFKKGEAVALYSVGRRQAFLGMAEDAVKNLTAAIKIFEILKDKSYEARSHDGLGDTYLNEGSYDSSFSHFQKALALRTEIADNRGIGVSRLQLGWLHFAQSKNHEALESAYQALRISEQVGDKENLSMTLVLIGHINESQENYPEALLHYQKCLKIFEELGIKPAVASAHKAISEIFLMQGKYNEAMQKNLLALEVYEDWQVPEYIAWAYSSMGDILTREGTTAAVANDKPLSVQKFAEAKNRYLQALEIYEKIKSRESLASINCRLGTLYLELNNLPVALGNAQSARCVHSGLKSRSMSATGV